MRLVLVFLGAAVVMAGVSASATKAPANPARAEVARAKASLEAAVDKVFVEIWTQSGEDMLRDNISSASIRAAGKWMMIGYSFGLCRSLVSNRLMADWMTAYDMIGFGHGPRADEARVRFRTYGLAQVAKGQADSSYGVGGSETQRNLCGAELVAIDEILDGPL